MSVADHFGLDDPESPLLAEARVAWVHWRIQDSDLAVVDDLLDLRDWTRRAQSAAKDPVLAKLAARLSDLPPEIDGLVAGQLSCHRHINVGCYRLIGPGWHWGPVDSPLIFDTKAAGVRPESITVVERRGCDLSPVDVATQDGAAYLASFV